MELFGYFAAIILLGGLVLVIIGLLARPISRVRFPSAAPKPSAALSNLEQIDAAYIIARREGGRIEEINDRARKMFGLNGDLPNLHRMARLAKPEDSFYDLLTAEGRANLTVANRLVEATSILFPHDTPQYVLMVLRENTALTGLKVDDRSSQAITALAEVGRALSASLDLETTLHAVLQTVGRIVQYDLGEINLWEGETQVLRPRVRNGDRPSLVTIDQRVHFYRLDEGYSGWLASHKRSLLISNIEHYTEVKPKLAADEFPFKSMIGVPLLYGKDGELVGTLELASFYPDSYTEQDLILLETVAGQAAIAIRNAQRYSQQETRIAELSGLAQVAQTAATLGDAHELYASLVDRIAKLMSVQFCGFLLYNERERALIAQPPFRSVPEAFRERYRIFAPPDSQAARMWRESESWYTDDMRVDPRVEEFGVKTLAEALGMSASLIVPLIVGGNRLGVVQVANKLNQSPFNEEDARLLRTLAGQAAVLIDNARLVREAEARVHRADVLRQISEITGSALGLDEIYQAVMGRVAKLLDADIGVVLLLDETKGELVPQPGSLHNLNPVDAELVYLRTDSPDFKWSITMTRRPFFTWHASRDRRITSQFRRAIDYFKLESIIAVPLVVQDRNIGEMWWGAVTEHRFAKTDVPLVATVAAQLASAIERARLASITDDTLRRRVEQLTALTRVGRELNQTIELEHILRLVYDETVRTTHADCGSILLLDPDTPAAPAARMRIGAHSGNLTLNVLEYDAALSGNTHIIPDITASGALESLKLGALPAGLAAPGHTPIRSLLVAPITYQGITVGIIELHSRVAGAFDKVMLDFSQAIAAQAAVAVGNAQRYEEQIHRGELLRRRAEQLSQLLQISRSVRSDRPLETNLEAIAYGVQEAVGFNVVTISVLDSDTQLLRRLACAGAPIAEAERLKQNPVRLEAIQPALQPQFRISHSYYVPHHRTPEALRTLDTVPVPRAAAPQPGEWVAGDFLFVPLVGSGGHIVGMMTVDDPRHNQAPDLSTIETLEIFANQSALAIENARLYQSAESRAAELSQSLGQLQKSYHELDVVSRTLSRKEQELSTLIQQTELRARRLLGLHRIASATADVRVEDDLLQRAARATVSEMDVDVCLIALLRAGGFLHIAAQATAANRAIDLGPSLGLHNPLSHIINIRSPLLARDLHGWRDSKLAQSLQLKSFVGVPIYIANTLSGALLVGNQLADKAPFVNEDIDLLTILSGQIGASLENIRLYVAGQQQLATNQRLYAETRELQEFNTAVFESLQVGLVVLNAEGVVLSINSWMRQTYGWSESLIGHNIFEFRPLYRDVGLADAIIKSVVYNHPLDRLTIRESAADGSIIVSSFYGYPLRRENKVTGVILLVEDVTEQARLEADVRERAAQLQALTEASRVMSAALREENVVALVLDQVAHVVPYDSATLWLRDAETLRVANARGFENDADQLGLVVQVEDSQLFKEMSESGMPIIVPDVREDARFPAGVISRTRSWLGAPLLSKGKALGLLALDKVEADFYAPSHADLAIAFANQVAVALDNAQLFEQSVQRALQLNERTQRLVLLNRVSGELNTTLELSTLIDISAREMSSALDLAGVVVTLYDDTGAGFTAAEYPPREEALPSDRIAPADDPVTNRLRETKAPIVIDDVALSDLIAPADRLLFVRQSIKAMLIVPLLAGGNLLGAVRIDHKTEQERFRLGEIELAQTIANQTASAIQNARLFGETQRLLQESRRHSTEMSTLYDLGMTASQVLDLSKLIEVTLAHVQQLLQVNSAALVRVTESSELIAEAVESGRRLKSYAIPRTGSSLPEYVINAGRPLLIGDLRRDKPPVAGYDQSDPAAHAWLGVPLLARGVTVGAIVTQSEAPDFFGESQLRLLSQVANQTAIALENARLFEAAQTYAASLEHRVAERTAALEKERDRVETLLRITSELSASLDLDRVLTRAISLVSDVIGGDSGGLFLIDAQSETLIHRAALGSHIQLPPGGQPAPYRRGDGLVGWVIKNQEPVIIPDLLADQRWIRRPIGDERHRSAICVPLMSSEDCLGAMIFFSEIPDAFSDDQLRLVVAAANQVTSAINNAELYRLIRDQAERLGAMLRANQVEASKSRAILESIADGVLVSDPLGKITLFNATAERILKLNRDDVLGRPVRDFMGIYGLRAKSLIDTIEKWSEDPSSYQPGEYLAERLTLDDQRIVSVLLAPVTTADEFLGTVSIFRDITREVEVDRLKTEFVTTVSHELRTPITPIKGYADVLLMGMAGPLVPEQQRFIELIKTNADRLKILVDDLLDISKIESGKVELQLEPLDIAGVITEVIGHVRGRMSSQNKPLTVLTEIEPDLPSALGDHTRMVQVLTNLADNAFLYTEAKGAITFGARREGDTLLLSVKDTGVGLAPEDKIRVFDRFYRGENPLVMASAGAGLGLSIVLKLVDMHGGQIWAESEGLGHGSTFFVRLKLAAAPEPALAIEN